MATDSLGASAVQPFQVKVGPATNMERRPFFETFGITTAKVGAPYSYTATARDIDGAITAVTVLEKPSGMTAMYVGTASVTLAWTPTKADIGEHMVHLRAADDGSQMADQQFVIVVSPAEAGRPDLIISKVDVSAATVDAQSRVLSGTAQVAIANQGASRALGFDAVVFEDRDGDEAYDASVDALFGREHLAGLESGQRESLDVPVAGTVLFRDNRVMAMVDVDGEVSEANETNNVTITTDGERFVRSTNPFAAQIKLHIPSAGPYGTFHAPLVVQWNDDNGDGVIDAQDTPDILYIDVAPTKIHVRDGQTGADVVPAISYPYVDILGTPAVGDVNGDGKPEIVTPGVAASPHFGQGVKGLVAFDHDGNLMWENRDTWGDLIGGSVSLVDVDGDGKTEAVFGKLVVDAMTGVKRCQGIWTSVEGTPGQYGAGYYGPFASVADINLDGKPEIVTGSTVSRNDCSVLWSRPDLTFPGSTDPGTADGYTGVADFDGDGYGEIVLVSFGRVLLLDHNGQTVWEAHPPFARAADSDWAGAPAIGDVDGDGEPEIAVGGFTKLVVIESNGTVRWSRAISDPGSGNAFTGITMADLDGDGAAEVIFADGVKIHIYRGATGEELYSNDNPSATCNEYPTPADVDGDGRLDLVVVANDPFAGTPMWIRVYGGAAWAPGRNLWTQYDYHVTNIRCDQKVPPHETRPWPIPNTVRTGGVVPPSLRESLGCDYRKPDLTASYLRVGRGECPNTAGYTVRVGNGGLHKVEAGVAVHFWLTDEAGTTYDLGVASTSTALRAGEYEDVSLSAEVPSTGALTPHAEVDPDAATKDPVRTNNTHAWAAPQLVCGGENQGPYFASTPPLRANATVPWLYVVGTVDADNDLLTLSLAQGPAGMTLVGDELRWLPTMADVGPEHAVSLVLSDGRGGSQQQDFVLVVGQPPLPPGEPVPNVKLTLATDRSSYGGSEVVTISAELSNLVDPGRNGTLHIDVADAFGAVIATPLASQSVVFIGSGSQGFTATYDTGVVPPGSYQIVAHYQEGSAETVATASFVVTVLAEVEVSLATSPFSSHQQVPITTRYHSLATAGIAHLQPTLTVLGPDGTTVMSQALSQVDLAAGAFASRLAVFETATRAPGLYAVRLVVLQDGVEVGRAQGSFTIRSSADQPGEGLLGTLSVTPESVPWDSGTVTLKGALTNNGNIDLTGLEVHLRVVDPRDQAGVRDDVRNVDLPLGGQTTVTASFAVTGLGAGSYVAVLEAIASGVTPVSASVPFMIIDTIAPQVSIEVAACSAQQATPIITVVEENLTSQQATLDGAPYVPGTPVTDEGAHDLRVVATDIAGLTGTASAHFVVDGTAPVVTFAQVAPGVVARSFSPVVQVADPNLVSQTMTLDGAPFSEGTVVEGEGHHQLSVTATDCAGNVTSETVEFDVDLTAPVVAISVPPCTGENVVPVIQSIDLHLQSQVALLDGLPYNGEPVLAEGSHVLAVVATDLAGNVGGQAVTFVIDRTAPSLVVSGVANGTVVPAAVEPTVAIVDPNLVTSSLALNGAPFASGTRIEAEGEYALGGTARDCAGNVGEVLVSFAIDRTGPAIAIEQAPACSSGDVAPVIRVTDAHPASETATVDGQPFVNGMTVSGEGTHTLAVSASDRAGNSTTSTTAFVIDRTAPAIELAGVVDGAAYPTSVAPTINFTDSNLVSSSVTLDGSHYLSGAPIGTEGSHTLAATATDCAGNTAQAGASFLLDFVPPSVEITGAPGCGQGPATLVVAATDAAEPDVPPTRSCSLDGQPLPSCDAITVDSEGEHVLAATATDRAGNQSPTTQATFIVDRTAPQVQIQGVAEGGAYGHEVTPLIVATDQHLSSQTATLNGAPFASGTPIATDGAYELAATARDCAGNQATSTVRFDIDTEAPKIVIDVPACAAGLVTPVITVTEAHVATDERLLDGQPYDNGGVTAEGQHTLKVTVTDTAGNTATQSVDFTVDNTAPTIVLNGVESGQSYNHPVTPEIVFQDAVEITLTLNDQPFTSGTAVSEDGDYALAATAKDCAGNQAELHGQFQIDQVAPAVEILVADCQEGPVMPFVTVSDGHLAGDERTLDGQPWDGSAITAEGSHTLVVVATDNAGNRTERQATFIVDNTAPVIAVAGVVDGAWYNGPVTPLVSITETNLITGAMTLNGQVYLNETPVGVEGAHLLVVEATDCAGHVATNSTGFNLDFTLPALVLADVLSCTSSDVIPVVTADEPVTLAETMDGLPYEAGIPVTGEGSHHLNAVATDRAGNTSSLDADFVIDRTPPQLGFVNVIEGGAYRLPVSPLINATDANLVSVSSTLDGQPFTNGTVVSADGYHVLSATAIDCAGQTVAANATFLIDQVGPVVSIAVPACAIGPVTPQITVVEANPASQTQTLDGASYSGGPVNTEGTHVVAATVLDKAGNQGSASAQFILDKTAPTVSIGGVQDGVIYQLPVAPTVSASDINLTGTTATLNGLPFTSGTLVTEDGWYDLVVSALDCAGNSTIVAVQFQIQSIAGTLSHAIDDGSRMLLANEGGGAGSPQLLRTMLTSAAIPWEEAATRTEWLGKLRSGRFNHVAIYKPGAADSGSYLPELNEAVWLGDGLIVIKNTTNPSASLREAAGVDFSTAKVYPTKVTLLGPLQPSWVPMTGTAVKLTLAGATAVARPFGDNYSVLGATVMRGLGESVTLAWDPETSASQTLYQSLLSASAPASGAPLLAGGTTRLRTTIHNTSVSTTEYALVHTLSPALCTMDSLQYTFTVPGGATQDQIMTVHLPTTAGDHTVTSRLSADGRELDEKTFTFAVTLTTGALHNQAVSGLQGLNLTGTADQKRDQAVALLSQATQAATPLDAVGLAWRAIDAIRGITGVNLTANRVDLARLLRSYQMATGGSGVSANLDGLPCFHYAITAAAACSKMPPSPIDGSGCITINSSTYVDSYSHSVGAYGGSNQHDADVAMRCNDRAHDSNNTCWNNCGTSCISGDVDYLVDLHYTTIPEPPSTPNTTKVYVNSGQSVTLNPAGGVAFYDTLGLNSGGTLTLKTGSYVVKDLLLNSGGTFKIDGTVRVWVRNPPSPNTPVSITSNNPRDFWLIYSGTGTINNNSGNKFYGVLFAPAAKVNLNFEVFGAVVAGGVTLNSGAKVHYDTDLTCPPVGGSSPDAGVPGQCTSDPGATF